MAWTYYPASTLPAPFDIVWSHFPEALALDKPAPKSRPALVLQTAVSEPGFCPEVRVAYGTSNLKLATRKNDLFVQNYEDMSVAGLYQATRFDLDNIIWLPWAEEWFVPVGRQYSSPVMGRLPEHHRRILGFMMIERQRKKDQQS